MSSDSGAGSTLRPTGISKDEVLRTDYAMMTLVSIFVLSRIVFQAIRRKKLEIQDYLIYLAYLFYVALCALYITAVPILFQIQDVTTGVLPMPPDFTQTAGLVSRLIWKLLVGLPLVYTQIWWAIIIFCFLSFVGCVTSTATSCKSLPAFFATSECYLPEEVFAQTVSLYLAFALDVFTDILVMVLPLRLVWNLQMPRLQKVAICAMFGTGLICVSFAIIRVVQIGINDKGQASTPEPKWLTLWSVLETSMAVIVGCSPAFAALFRLRRPAKRESSHGYIKQSNGFSGATSNTPIRLKTLASSEERYTCNGRYGAGSNT